MEKILSERSSQFLCYSDLQSSQNMADFLWQEAILLIHG